MAIARPLIYAHIGDLHIEVGWDTNYRDFRNIVAALKSFGPQIDFLYLPGDIANNGKRVEFERVTEALRPLGTKRVHAISGDHEMVQGSLDNFYACLRLPGNVAPKQLPYAETIAPGVTGIFLDMCGRGTGQADFRLDPKADPKHRRKRTFEIAHQVAWLRDGVIEARRCVVFMHTYPADLVDPLEQAAVVKILSAPNVLLVDIGHTHYNEISNDGQKLYAATRSTGQIEEGEVGYAITTIDDDIVSWRFRLLAAQGPIVLITSPADRRLATIHTEAASGACDLRVTVLSMVGRVACTYSVDGGRPKPITRMPRAERGRHRFADMVPLPAGARFITVSATDSTGDGEETIQLAREADKTIYRHADGSDADRLGRWSDRGLLATQLGPNRNGTKW